MEIINATPKVTSGFVSSFETLKRELESLKNQSEDKRLKKWMDTQDVLFTLRISARTLQNYRDRGELSYSQVGNKFYYKPADVMGLVSRSKKIEEGVRYE